jgi:menaquinol-cytochrome c reductase iron-sulfur subunit
VLGDRADGKLTALSTTCPHLGCAVDFDAAAGKFKCPCHRSAFTLDGTVEEGPSPRPMDALELQETDGLVAIRFQRFRTGVSDKEPV